MVALINSNPCGKFVFNHIVVSLFWHGGDILKSFHKDDGMFAVIFWVLPSVRAVGYISHRYVLAGN